MRICTWQGISIFTEHKDCVKLAAELLSLDYCSFLLIQATPNHTEQSHRVAVAGQCFIKPNQSRAWCPVLLLGFSHWFPRMSFWATRSYFGFQTPKSLCTKNRTGTGTCFWGMFLRHSLRQGIDIVASGRDGSEEIPSHCQVQPRFCR